MNYKKITLDTERKSFESIIAMQGDNKSRYIDATIVNKSIPINLTGCTVKFSAIKPDITDIFNDVSITNPTAGKVKIELTNQTLSVPGVVQATLVILKEDMQLSVLPFFITVIENPYNPNAIESKSEYKALNSALTVVDGYAKELQDASVNLEEKYTIRLNYFDEQLDKNKNDILKIKDYTLKNAKFKPNFKHNLYWCEKTELDWENDLLVFKKCGIKKAVLVVMIEKDSDNTFRLENKFEKYIKFLNDNHVKYDITHVDIKIHFNFSNQIVIDFGRFDFIPIYEKLVEQIVRYVHDNISNLIKVENVTYLNETWFYNRTWKLEENWVEDKYTQSKYHAFWDNLKTIVNKYGYKNSVCFAGVKGYITASSYLLNTLDFIGINTYPSLSQSFEKTTIEQCIESWKCHDIYNQIKEIRNSFPNKPIFITETGCQDWWASLIRTESYNMDIKYRVPSHGITTYLMMKSFFEVFNDLIDEVWWWFEVKQSNYDKNIAMIKEYVGGEY